MTTQLTPETTRQLHDALTQVCTAIGVNPDDATLIKYTMNAVFRVGPYVLRLSRGTHAAALAARTCKVAMALERAGIPTTRLAHEIAPEPVMAGEWIATVWHHVDAVNVAPEPVDLAVPLQAIHTLTDFAVELPTWAPVDKFRRRITAARKLPEAASKHLEQWSLTELSLHAQALLSMLEQWCDEAEQSLLSVEWRLVPGVIHADAHTGNLLLRQAPARPGPDPSALLCDHDGMCHGPREWDLIPTAHGTTRFGRPRESYEHFANAYGFDITTWSGWPALSRLRELQLVTSTIDSLNGRPSVAEQLALRLNSLLAADDSCIWSRYV